MTCHYAKGLIKLYALCAFVQYQDGQKRRKPNYSSVDLSEVEWEDKDDIVRAKKNHVVKHHFSKYETLTRFVSAVFCVSDDSLLAPAVERVSIRLNEPDPGTSRTVLLLDQ